MNRIVTALLGAAAALPLATLPVADASPAAGATVNAWNPGAWVVSSSSLDTADTAIPMGVRFQRTRAGSVVVRGHVRPSPGTRNPGWNFFHLDTDDNNAGTVVAARLYRSPAGAFTGNCAAELISTVTSSDRNGCHTDFVGVAHGWDFDIYVYWVEVTLSRRTADRPNVTAYRVALHA